MQGEGIVQLPDVAAHRDFVDERATGYPLQVHPLDEVHAPQVTLDAGVGIEAGHVLDPEAKHPAGGGGGGIPGREAIREPVGAVGGVTLPFGASTVLEKRPAPLGGTTRRGPAPHQQDVRARRFESSSRVAQGIHGRAGTGGRRRRYDEGQAADGRGGEQLLAGTAGRRQRGFRRTGRGRVSFGREADQDQGPFVGPDGQVRRVEPLAEGHGIKADPQLPARHRLVLANKAGNGTLEPAPVRARRRIPLARDLDQNRVQRQAKGLVQRRAGQRGGGHLGHVQLGDRRCLQSPAACQDDHHQQDQLGLRAPHFLIIATRLPASRHHEPEIMTAKQPLTYKDAGVDIDAGEDLVERIKPLARATSRPGVLGGIGGFGGLFEIDLARWPRPVLVSGTDGVGTKLKLAIDLDRYDTIGIDLVAMCANDVIVQGAEPLFFLDYYASGKLSVDTAAAVIRGIAAGCQQAGAALLGGETAELPGMYGGKDFDLAGFCVGIVNRDELIDGSSIRPGDAILGLASSGPHSNGYSLIRRVLEASRTPLDSPWEGGTLGAALLAPTRIYVRSLLALMATCTVRGLAHITGGGLPDNLVRVLPPEVDAILRKSAWQRPALFDWLQTTGNIPEDDLLRTFNCGIGMTVIVRPEDAVLARTALEKAGETVILLGEVTSGTGKVELRA